METERQQIDGLPEWYLDLVDRVAEISMDAAYYLEHDAPALPSFTFFPGVKLLEACFDFDETPQGRDYWRTFQERI